MPFINESDQRLLRQRFEERLEGEVTIKVFTESRAVSVLTLPGRIPDTGGGQLARQIEELMRELAELSRLLKVEVYDFNGQGAEEAKRLNVQRTPALVFGDATEGRVKFYGIPSGYEFATILEAIEGLSQGAPNLHPKVTDAIRDAVREPVHLQVFTTPT